MSEQSRKPNKYIDDMAVTGSAGETSESGWETTSAEREESPDTSFERPEASSSSKASNAANTSQMITTRSMTKVPGPAVRPLTDLISDMQSGNILAV
jgi:hypothetical protein